MILKWLGMAIVFFASAAAGYYYGGLDGFRAGDLMELKKALGILRAEIEFARAPLSEALESAARRTKKSVGAIFARLSRRVAQERGTEMSVMWEECVRECADATFFNAEDIEQLVSFGRTLGYLDSGMQLTGITILADYISSRLEALNQTRGRNKRVFQSLGVLGGLLMIVIFI